jgi:hypothetical protein
MKKKLNKRKEKNFKRKKNKIRNILNEKKLKGKKLVVGVLGAALLCAIHVAPLENTLFEDDGAANTFRVFNPTQAFLHLKKNLLMTRCGVRANILVIILLRNVYFLKYCFKKNYSDNIFLFVKINFLYHHIKIIQKHQKILI